jgi:hypothetical protein
MCRVEKRPVMSRMDQEASSSRGTAEPSGSVDESAKRVSDRWPRTAAVLRSIAEGYGPRAVNRMNRASGFASSNARMTLQAGGSSPGNPVICTA